MHRNRESRNVTIKVKQNERWRENVWRNQVICEKYDRNNSVHIHNEPNHNMLVATQKNCCESMKENLFSPFCLIFIGIFSLSSIPFSILLYQFYFLRKFLPIKAPQANGIYGGLQCNPNEANMVTISNSTMIFYGSTHIHSCKRT